MSRTGDRPPFDGPVARIDLGLLKSNLGQVRAQVKPATKLLAAVKADAYGHGLAPVAKTLAAAGVEWFGVATPEEALELRHSGITGGVLLLTPVIRPQAVPALVDAGISLAVAGEHGLATVLAADLPGQANIHLKVDTGMGRLGLPPTGAAELARQIDGNGDLVLEGTWTHFTSSDDADPSQTLRQLERFEQTLALLARDGVEPGLRHAANSAAITLHPRSHFDMVRPGICLYGYYSSAHVAALDPGLTPVMHLSAPVTFVKRVRAGTTVSYGELWRAPKATTVATVRIGYADGYPRLLTGRASVGLRGRRVTVVGRICMDQLLVDVGDMPVEIGERVSLWGPGVAGEPDAEELAGAIGTVSYELLTGVGRRVEREYSEP